MILLVVTVVYFKLVSLRLFYFDSSDENRLYRTSSPFPLRYFLQFFSVHYFRKKPRDLKRDYSYTHTVLCCIIRAIKSIRW